MRKALKPILFDDHEEKDKSISPVEGARPSEAAKNKAQSKKTPDGLPVHSFQTLLKDLATITLNDITFDNENTFQQKTTPTNVQKKILSLLKIKAL